MSIATKDGSVIVKNGSIGTECGCCGEWYCYDYSVCACANNASPYSVHPQVTISFDITRDSYGKFPYLYKPTPTALPPYETRYHLLKFSAASYQRYYPSKIATLSGGLDCNWSYGNFSQIPETGQYLNNPSDADSVIVASSCSRAGVRPFLDGITFAAVGFYPYIAGTNYQIDQQSDDPASALFSPFGYPLVGRTYFDSMDSIDQVDKLSWPPMPLHSQGQYTFSPAPGKCFEQATAVFPLVKYSVISGASIERIIVGTMTATITS